MMCISPKPAVALILLLVAGARAATLSVSATATPEAFPLATQDSTAQVVIDSADAKVVQIAAGLFADDVERVTGRKPAIGNKRNAGPTLLVGTLGSNAEIDKLVAAHVLDVSPIQGKWEAYEIALLHDPANPNAPLLVIAGSDRRATAYGLLSLSQSIGVSPWYWWADVPPQKKSTIYLSLPTPITDAPAVKYRGIFINDEDWGLNPWASKTFDPSKNIGPKTYEKVFELLLRLKLNYLWPAMHACSTSFGSIPENAALANDYAIVAGSSHCEPMLYNNVKWNEKTQGKWNYTTNKDAIHSVWEDDAKTRGNYEAVWTLGIRGIHDAAMETPPKDTISRIKVLSDVIHDQRQLLDQYVTRQYGEIAQCFVPYKEVQPLYDAGLKVPDDVTLVWTDDNFGYIRRLSNPDERKRPGGSGVYYHLSYYGGPHSYTWINTTPPALMYEELHKAWDNDARTLWVLNVGDLKPAEIGIDYYAHLAWNAATFGPDSQPTFLKKWAEQTFGESSGFPIAEALTDFYQLGTIRKPEEMDRNWAASLSDGETHRLGSQYQTLLAESDAAAASVPPDSLDAFTETIGFPAHILADSGLLFLADRAHNDAEVARLRTELEAQVANYNNNLAHGKWKYIMPGVETGKDLPKWSSQVRWPWGEKPDAKIPSAAPGRAWRNAAEVSNISLERPAWTPVSGLGCSGKAMALLPASLSSSWQLNDPSAPTLQYNFTTTNTSAPDILLQFLPTFRLYPGTKLRIAIAIDNQPAKEYEIPGSSGTEDERGPIRSNAVQSNSVQLQIPLTNLSPGPHTLKISAIDPGAVIDQISLPDNHAPSTQRTQ